MVVLFTRALRSHSSASTTITLPRHLSDLRKRCPNTSFTPYQTILDLSCLESLVISVTDENGRLFGEIVHSTRKLDHLECRGNC
jgi:hypothetical protein